jgi:hypothetical protein
VEQSLKQHCQVDASEASLQPSSADNQSDSPSTAAAATLLLDREASAGNDDPFAEQPVLPVTWLSYKGQGSSTFLVWVAGQAAGQVSSAAAAHAVFIQRGVSTPVWQTDSTCGMHAPLAMAMHAKSIHD